MVEVKLTEDCMRLISQFESLTGAGSRDCVVDERNSRLIFVINPGDMGLAIGKKGVSIKKASEVMEVRLHNLNQWKDQSLIDRATFFTKESHESYKDSMNIRFSSLEQSKAFLEGKASVGTVIIGAAISIAISLLMHLIK